MAGIGLDSAIPSILRIQFEGDPKRHDLSGGRASPPVREESLTAVSIGVLHHTPAPRRGFESSYTASRAALDRDVRLRQGRVLRFPVSPSLEAGLSGATTRLPVIFAPLAYT